MVATRKGPSTSLRYARGDEFWSFAFAEGDDAVDQGRYHPGREIMPPAGPGLDLGARHEGRDVAAAGDRQQRIVLTVQHQRRHLDGLELLDPLARGDDREILPGAALRVPAAVDVLLDEAAQLGLGDGIAPTRDRLAELDAILHALLAR